MRLPGLLLIACVTALGLPGAAASQTPRGSAVVAEIAGATLRVYDRKADLCVMLDGVAGGSGTATSCGPAVRLETFAAARLVTVDGEAPAVGGAVPPEVARVEAVPTTGAPVPADTVAGEAYRGRRAGKVRFFLASLPEGTELLELRLLSADGTLLAVEEAAGGRRPPVVGPIPIGTIREGGRRLPVTGETIEELEPNLVDPGHRARFSCLVVRDPSVEVERSVGWVGIDELSRTCSVPGLGSGSPASLDLRPGCGPARTYLAGSLAAGERTPRLVLGSGRRLRPRAFTLPAQVGGGRAWVAVVPGREAVRRIEWAGGGSLPLAQAPAAASCDPRSGSSFFGYYAFAPAGPGEPFGDPVTPPDPPAVAARQGDAALLAADGPDDRLCLALEPRALRISDCTQVRRGDENRSVNAARPGGGRVAGGVTPLPASSALLRFADGSTVTTPVGPPLPDGYAGAYGGKVRFYAALAPTSAPLRQVTLRNAAGRALSVQDADPFYGTIRAVRAVPGTPRLFTARVRFRGAGTDTTDASCLSERRPRLTQDCALLDGRSPEFSARVDCAPRATTLLGRVPARTASVSLELAGGRRRTVAVRPGGVVFARLRRDEALRAVRVRLRKGATRRNFRLPPAAAQCGYSSSGT